MGNQYNITKCDDFAAALKNELNQKKFGLMKNELSEIDQLKMKSEYFLILKKMNQNYL